MYSYLWVCDDVLFCADGAAIVVYGDELRRIQHSRKILHMECGLAVDEDKSLLEVGGELVFVTKLHKAVSKIVRLGQHAYIADRFGDVLRVDLDTKQIAVVMGNMCYNTSMCMYGGMLLTSDKYGRVRVSRTDGSIEKYLLNDNKPVLSMIAGKHLVLSLREEVKLVDDGLHVTLRIPFDGGNIRKLVQISDDSFLVCGDKTWVVRGSEVMETRRKVQDAIWFREKIAFIAEKELFLDNKLLCTLEADHEDFIKNIEIARKGSAVEAKSSGK